MSTTLTGPLVQVTPGLGLGLGSVGGVVGLHSVQPGRSASKRLLRTGAGAEYFSGSAVSAAVAFVKVDGTVPAMPVDEPESMKEAPSAGCV